MGKSLFEDAYDHPENETWLPPKKTPPPAAEHSDWPAEGAVTRDQVIARIQEMAEDYPSWDPSLTMLQVFGATLSLFDAADVERAIRHHMQHAAKRPTPDQLAALCRSGGFLNARSPVEEKDMRPEATPEQVRAHCARILKELEA
ncbi:MAG: hypothetical protein B7733_06270 [Myxococcales bacterium FL481]|nr:MAG: hypothetical protein B7733_06270 [Myxococcales bacterium FL481]